MDQDLNSYLEELEQRALHAEGGGDRGTLVILGILVAGVAAFLTWTISEVQAYAALASVATAALAIPLFLYMRRCSSEAWRRRRPQVIQHMQRSIFGDGELGAFLRERGLSEADPRALEDFMESFMSANFGRQGYYYGLGFLGSGNLVRSSLMLTLVMELRQALSVFDDSEAADDSALPVDQRDSGRLPSAASESIPDSEPVLRLERERRGWNAPTAEELVLLESELLQLVDRPDYGVVWRAGLLGSGLLVYAYFTELEYSQMILAAGLPLLIVVTFVVWLFAGQSANPLRRQELLANLQRELFEEHMLRDFIRARRDFNEGRFAGQYVPAELQHAEEHPLQLLQWFAEHYVGLRSEPYGRNSRVYRYPGGEYFNMQRLQLLTSLAAAQGLRYLLEREPEVFASW